MPGCCSREVVVIAGGACPCQEGEDDDDRNESGRDECRA